VSGPDAPATTADPHSSAGDGDRAAPSLLCVDGERSFSVTVPPAGELVIGRGPEAGLSLDDALVSRAHARILATPEGLRVTDLGSRHGTLVNGERVADARLLRGGDVVGVGTAVLIVRRAPRPRARAAQPPAALTSRLTEELARCVAYEREVSVLVVRVPDGADVDALVAALGERVRPIDTVAAIGARHVGVIAPELDADEALRLAAALAAARGVAVGVATAPEDGIDPDGLLAAARAASDRDDAGRRPVRASDAIEPVAVGAHRALIADPAMVALYELARRLARSAIPVLVLGETGVGKELAAAAVHAASPRHAGPFVSVNCAAIPESLAESELFGHAKGAFSGALAAKPGRIEIAAGGTLFLDEIGELPLAIQAKLLRVLESGELSRVGEVSARKVDLRIVAATNRDLQREVDAGRFRGDLYFRLGAARLELPPLRERPRDLAVLVTALLREACARLGGTPLALSPGAAIALYRYRWPGNVRELRHAVDYAAAAAPDTATELEVWHLPRELAAEARRERDGATARAAPGVPAAAPDPAATSAFRPIADEVRELERDRMIAALRATRGAQNRAAELIEMPLRTFVTKLKRYAITASDWS
jgi:DNA-binding NtrC family response regulator